MTSLSDYRYGECRLLGHSWEVVPSDWTPAYGEPFTCRCERCSLERRDSVNRRTGAVEGRRYVWPDGYLWHHDEGETVPSRADWRVAWLEGEIDKSRRRREARARAKRRRTA